MKATVFDGPAGSGKTTKMVEELVSHLLKSPLNEGQKVLAITRMHGSRRRLQSRLYATKQVGRNCLCATIDSFAWRLLHRWRSLAKNRLQLTSDHFLNPDFQHLCSCAASLLRDQIIQNWVKVTYPVIIVDEMQDSKVGQLSLLKELSNFLPFIGAADDFQDLDGVGNCEAVVWARSSCNLTTLSQIHRTSITGMLSAANALRNSLPLNNALGFLIQDVPSHSLGAWHVANFIRTNTRHGQIAILTPTKGDFAEKILIRVQEKPIGKNPIGPYLIHWEGAQKDEEKKHLASLGLNTRKKQLDPSTLNFSENNYVSNELENWIRRCRNLTGQIVFATEELKTKVSKLLQQYKQFRQNSIFKVFATTIQQAKNREFESVIVLWPYQVQGNSERLRRLLYNAITRARRSVIVIVQNNPGRNNRLLNPPFS